MRVIKNPAWVYYLADIDPHFDKVKVGKEEVVVAAIEAGKARFEFGEKPDV